MKLIMKDGGIKMFEVSLAQFNQLRYNVAKVACTCSLMNLFFILFLKAMREIQVLERHPIIKIVNEFKKREEEESYR